MSFMIINESRNTSRAYRTYTYESNSKDGKLTKFVIIWYFHGHLINGWQNMETGSQ